ncbi:hypothetical protein jhhlp_006097 [Lomentospora prolificans]|uniref:Gfo/Idh/MocA-like oxidoreductase N-terminal domain-containing protein n=1 Tax=Lomentospora prolificans TaxID=41688 RepID=A0A2N3N4Y2_9PEZI|nr:hypothetical protein jhhlp_006097 [Lomentospora prolificans]
MAPVGVAIIGGGIWVKMHHLPSVLACQNLSLKAIYSRTLASAQKAAQTIPPEASVSPDLYSSDSGPGKSYADLLARSDIEAVIVCVNIRDGPTHAAEALSAGKHVLSEKPIAANIEAAKKLIDHWKSVVAGGKNVSLSIAENFRFFESVNFATKESKKLGKLNGFQGRMFFPIGTDNSWLTDWRKQPTHQGGFVLDAGIHFIAYLRSILGHENALESVSAYTAQVQPHLPPLDTVHCLMRTKSGVVGSICISSGTLYLESSETLFSFEDGAIIAEAGKVIVKSADLEAKKEGRNEVDTDEQHFDLAHYGVKEEVFAWAEGLVSGRPNPAQSVEEALADIEVMEKMFKSGQENGAVQKLEYQL